MGVTQFLIEFVRDVFYPGQMITGQVHVSIDKPKKIRAIELKISGKAKCHWTSNERYTDSENKTQWRTKNHYGKQKYIGTKVNLTPAYSQFILPSGNHVYPFSVELPSNSPATFNGTYGSITYAGKAKLDIPMAFDKSEKKFFTVRNVVNLTAMPELQKPYKDEKSKTFCCWCCASGPLTIVAHLPKTGFVNTEEIPITVEVDNASNVAVDNVKAKLYQKITWHASDDTKQENNKLKTIEFGSVEQNNSATWSKSMQLGPETYPNTGTCEIIKIKYVLEIEADASGPHSDLDMHIPLQIGDVRCDDNEMSSQIPNLNPVVVQAGFIPIPAPGIQAPINPTLGLGFPLLNPDPVAPAQMYPPAMYPAYSTPPIDYGPVTGGSVYPNQSFNPSGCRITESGAPGVVSLNAQPYPAPQQPPSETLIMSYPPQPATAP